jgi:peptide/nickel transport system ATP-binding protein
MEESAPTTVVEQEQKSDKLIEIKNLRTYFYTDDGIVKSVDDVSYDIYQGETLGLVGESGCGKSVSAMSIMRLIPMPPGKIVSGQILFHGRDLTKISDLEMRKIRGNRIGMIFQEPMTSLNPVYTVGDQIMEAITLHMGKDYAEARELAIGMLEKVGIPSPRQRIDVYPHQMSGGMKQRVMIAMSLVCNPELLIADEPTTALDVTIQAQILDLLRELQKEFRTSILLITHDLGVIAETAHRVVVMYASKVAEIADILELFANPKHPYTMGLFNSIPKIDDEDRRLIPIKGVVPNPLEFPAGCKFHTRCDFVMEKCRTQEPPLVEVAPRHKAACWLNEEKKAE